MQRYIKTMYNVSKKIHYNCNVISRTAILPLAQIPIVGDRKIEHCESGSNRWNKIKIIILKHVIIEILGAIGIGILAFSISCHEWVFSTNTMLYIKCWKYNSNHIITMFCENRESIFFKIIILFFNYLIIYFYIRLSFKYLKK